MSFKAITRNIIVNKEKVRDIVVTDTSVELRVKIRIKYIDCPDSVYEVSGDKDHLIEEINANINEED